MQRITDAEKTNAKDVTAMHVSAGASKRRDLLPTKKTVAFYAPPTQPTIGCNSDSQIRNKQFILEC
jgi:hypothetical protein